VTTSDPDARYGQIVVTHVTALLDDRYRLDYQIAAGGIGEVWQAQDVVLDRPVAVKLLRPEYAQHAETRERFRFEARHAASLTHPAIARMFDYHEGGTRTRPFLVMELIEGPSLADVLEAGPLDPPQVMDIVAQAAAGLDAAHQTGLVHRDIKPANLLLCPDGTVKITDFGIAYAAGSTPVTRHGQLIGTPAYLAPERVAGQAAGPASDLYSLGILAHECLTGARPFTGTPAEIAVAHSQRALPDLPDSVPAPVARFVAELTAKDVAARPASARLVAARAVQLRDWLTGSGALQQSDHLDVAWTQASDTHPATLVGEQLWGLDQQGDWPSPSASGDHGWPRRRVALAIAVASVAAGLVGWLVSASTAADRPPPAAPAASHAASKPSSPAVSTVTVNAAALVGQPVRYVADTLRSLGLQPQVSWVPPGSDQGAGPGTVVSVQPSGQVPAGSTVTVTAIESFGGGFGDGGNGFGGGNGNGNGNGN
jgi:eukaryotic-like serine/threonine-protein kinase